MLLALAPAAPSRGQGGRAVSEAAVMDTPTMDPPTIETPAPILAPPEPSDARPIPERKARGFLASFRFNGLRYLTLIATLGLSWGFIRLATWQGIGPQESTFMYLLAGGMLAAAAKTAIDLMTWAE